MIGFCQIWFLDFKFWIFRLFCVWNDIGRFVLCGFIDGESFSCFGRECVRRMLFGF